MHLIVIECIDWMVMQVILSDGDLSTLANMKVNLELNHLSTGNHISDNLEHHDMVSPNNLTACLIIFSDFFTPQGSVSIANIDNRCIACVCHGNLHQRIISVSLPPT